MPISKSNQRFFTRTLFAGMLKTVQLLKRGIDQKQGTVVAYTVYQCRRSIISKSGEPIQNDMTSDHRTVWHIPRREMDRIGITDINAADRIVEHANDPNQVRWWQPESTTSITIKLWELEIDISCLRIDPPFPDQATNP